MIDICDELDIEPVLSGSLAVFSYTNDPKLEVNDIDLACSELDFPKIIDVLEQRGTTYRLKEWHILQILKDDLKIEFDSMEYWMRDISADYETLKVTNMRIKIVSLEGLKQLYKRGLDNTRIR